MKGQEVHVHIHSDRGEFLMDIYITVANGGVSNIRLTVYKYKDLIKEKFANQNFGDYITEISYFLFINGDVTRYYESSGVYKLSYKPKKKCMDLHICMDETGWSDDEDRNEVIFKNALMNLLIYSSEAIKEKSIAKKLDFNKDLFDQTLKSCLE
ncbi:Imm12 family immunity protein [Aneurinibacillus aneurinilyticus]|uniref:Imm12 family immunity protein n=2 Tax=Aneurinibacillus aneurinilyticus TaxID=1391 RepID=UPI002E22A30B|nr:Imm12 family immunity protein [Aneurinibacillus aneurinilyticus]